MGGDEGLIPSVQVSSSPMALTLPKMLIRINPRRRFSFSLRRAKERVDYGGLSLVGEGVERFHSPNLSTYR
jgi:hypothetical protein